MENKPTIWIYADSEAAALREICAGIEEEGVPYQTALNTVGGLEVAAHGAMNASALGCGVALRGGRAGICLRGFSSGRILLESDRDFRTLGINAARAVKKIPFREMEGMDA